MSTYVIYVQESSGWFKRLTRGKAYNADEAANKFASANGGRYQKIAVESATNEVFKVYSIQPIEPVQQFQAVLDR